MAAPDPETLRELASGVLAGTQAISAIPPGMWAAVVTTAVDLVAKSPSVYARVRLPAVVAAMASEGHRFGRVVALNAAADAALAVGTRISTTEADSPFSLSVIDAGERKQLSRQARAINTVLALPDIRDVIAQHGPIAHRILLGDQKAIDPSSREGLIWAAAAELATASVAPLPPLTEGSAFATLVKALARTSADTGDREDMLRLSMVLGLVADGAGLVIDALGVNPIVLPQAIGHLRAHAGALHVLYDADIDVTATRYGDGPGPPATSPFLSTATMRQHMLAIALWPGTDPKRAVRRILEIAGLTLTRGDARLVAALPDLLMEIARVVDATATLWGEASVSPQHQRLSALADELTQIDETAIAMRSTAEKILAGRYDILVRLPPSNLAALATALFIMTEPPQYEPRDAPSGGTAVLIETLASVANHVCRRGTADHAFAVQLALRVFGPLKSVLIDMRDWTEQSWFHLSVSADTIAEVLANVHLLLLREDVVSARDQLHRGRWSQIVASSDARAAAAMLLVGEIGSDRCLRLLGSVIRDDLVGGSDQGQELLQTLEILAPIMDWHATDTTVDASGRTVPYSDRVAKLASNMSGILEAWARLKDEAQRARAALDRPWPGEVPLEMLALGVPLLRLPRASPMGATIPLTGEGVGAIWREHLQAKLRSPEGPDAVRDLAHVILTKGAPLLWSIEGILSAGQGPWAGYATDVQLWLASLATSVEALAEGRVGDQKLKDLRADLEDEREPHGAGGHAPSWPRVGAGLVLAFALGVPALIPQKGVRRGVTARDIVDFAYWIGDIAVVSGASEPWIIDAASRTTASMEDALATLEPFLDEHNSRQAGIVPMALEAAAERLILLGKEGRDVAPRELVDDLWAGRRQRLWFLHEEGWLPLAVRMVNDVGRPYDAGSHPQLPNRHVGYLLRLFLDLATDLTGDAWPDGQDRPLWHVPDAAGDQLVPLARLEGETDPIGGDDRARREAARFAAADAAEVVANLLELTVDPTDRESEQQTGLIASRLMDLADRFRDVDTRADAAAAHRAAAPYVLGAPLDALTAPDLHLILLGALLVGVDDSGEAYLDFVLRLTRTLSERTVPGQRMWEAVEALRSIRSALAEPSLRDTVHDKVAEKISSRLTLLGLGLSWRCGHRLANPGADGVAAVARIDISEIDPRKWSEHLEAAACALDPFETDVPDGDSRLLDRLVSDLTELVVTRPDEQLREHASTALRQAALALAANLSVCEAGPRREVVTAVFNRVVLARKRMGEDPPDQGMADGGWPGPNWGPGRGGGRGRGALPRWPDLGPQPPPSHGGGGSRMEVLLPFSALSPGHVAAETVATRRFAVSPAAGGNAPKLLTPPYPSQDNPNPGAAAARGVPRGRHGTGDKPTPHGGVLGTEPEIAASR